MSFSITSAAPCGFGARAIAAAENNKPMTKKVSVKLPSTKAMSERIM